MNVGLATLSVAKHPLKAQRPGSLERLAVATMMFFLAFNAPNRWVLTVGEDQDTVLETPPDPLAVVLLLGFGAYFALKLAGNWRPIVWIALQDRLFVAFFAVIGLSTLWSVEPMATLRETIVLLMLIFFALYLVARFSIREVLAMAGAALGLGVLIDLVWVFALPQYGDTAAGWSGVHLNKNSLGRIHVLSAIVFLVGARTFRRFRLINYLFAILVIVLILGSKSTTSLVSLTLASFTTVVAQVFRARKTLFGAVVLSTVASAVAAVGFATASLGPITDLLGKDVTLTGRTPLWEFTVGESFKRPLTGSGWNAYWNGFFSPAHEVWTEFAWKPPHAHNAFVDYALQLGWPAVLLFTVMLARAGYRSVIFVRDTPGATGLFPLAMLVFCFMFSLSEAGVVARSIFFLLLTFCVYTISVARHFQQSESPNGKQRGLGTAYRMPR